MSPSAQRAQSGQAALILVIFIIVVLALLLAALAYITAGSNRDTGLTVLSTRSYYAAQSGAEWGTYQLAPATGSPASTCFTPQSISFNQPGISGCSAAVSCTSSTTAGATATTSFQVSSVGTCTAGAYSARREIVVGVRLTQTPVTKKACQKSCKQQRETCLSNCGNGDKNKACRRACNAAFTSCKKTCKPGGGGLLASTTSLHYWLENP